MSYETWREEYYPVPACDVPKEQAVAHSLRKWEGLRPEALAKHGIKLYAQNVGGMLSIASGSCALCHHYCRGGSCESCPLAIARAENDGSPVDCDKSRFDEDRSPWATGAYGPQNPEPMIAWLKKI